MKKILIITIILCAILSSIALASEPVVDNRANISILENQTYQFQATDFSRRFNELDVGNLTRVVITVLPNETQGVLKISGTTVTEPLTGIDIADIGNLTFVPATGFQGTASFSWRGKANTLSVQEIFTTNMIVSAPTDIININMTKNQVYQFKESDFTEKFDLLDAGNLTRVVITALPDNGKLKINDTEITSVPAGIDLVNINTLSFTPNENFVGTTNFKWRGKVNNVSVETVFTTNMIVGRGVPANTVNIYINKNETYRFNKTDFSTEYDLLNVGELGKVILQTSPEVANGTLKFNAAPIELMPYTIDVAQIRLLTYTPPTDFLGTATFTWNGKTGEDTNETVFTTNIIVQENKVLTAIDKNITTNVNTAVNNTLEVEQDVTVEFSIVDEPRNGTISNLDKTTGEFIYTPTKDYAGPDYFSYKATGTVNSQAVESNVGTITIDIKSAEVVLPFNYVDMKDHWANYSASHLAGMDIIVGEKVGKDFFFEPDKQITRADFVVYMLGILDIQAKDKTTSFTFADDASMPPWLKRYVYTAYQESIINGVLENGKIYFNPDKLITRAEAAKIINDSMKFKVQNTQNLTFTDKDTIPSWATTAIKNMVGYEIINGYNDKTFKPFESINKGELAEMLYKALKEKQIEINTAE